MNTIFITQSVRKVMTAVIVLSLAFSAVFTVTSVANAAVTLTTATLNGGSSATVAPGENVTIDVEVDKGNVGGCENNWRATRVSIDGNFLMEQFVGSILTGDPSTDSFQITAPLNPGTYTVELEIMGGGETFGQIVCDDNQVWASIELTLNVAIAPAIEVLSISPLNETRFVGDTNPVTYTAEIQVSGDPVSGNLQCVIFDLFRNDGWQAIDVTGQGYNVPGIYNIDLPLPDYDISTLAVGQYDVLVIASEETCAVATQAPFTTADFRNVPDSQYHAGTVLNIIDPIYGCTDTSALNFNPDATHDDQSCEYPVPACSVTIHSDETNTVVEKGGANAMALSFIHSAWTAVIAGATWIWGDNPVLDPANEETQTFEKSFVWNGPVTSAILDIAADNSYEVTVNGTLFGGDPSENNFAIATQDIHDISALIETGTNTLSIAVTNWAGNANPQSNPAGLLYRLVVEGDNQVDCTTVPTPTNGGGSDSSSTTGGGYTPRDRDDEPTPTVAGDSTSAPQPQVLGEMTDVMPLGAPATGHGGAAPVQVSVPTLFAVLASRLSRSTK